MDSEKRTGPATFGVAAVSFERWLSLLDTAKLFEEFPFRASLGSLVDSRAVAELN